MSIKKDLPSFESLFGELDFKKGEAARSVYSPAAYLADLLQLLDDYFEKDGTALNPKGFDTRRADIKQLKLNKENTFDLLPYLDIVNELLEQKVGADPYTTLKEKQYPFNLPFDLAQERLKKYLSYLNMKLEDIYKAFQPEEDSAIIAKAALGLSDGQYQAFFNRGFDLSFDDVAEREKVLTEQITPYLTKAYNAVEIGTLKKVDQFLKTTGITGEELRAILYQNLSASEKHLQVEFYANNFLAGYATLDKKEENIIWVGATGRRKNSDEVWPFWLARVSLLTRLAKVVDLSTTALDLIIRRCGNQTWNDQAMEIIAIIKDLQKKYDQPIDELAALFGIMEYLNQGEEDLPQDLFNRIFNNRFIEADNLYLKISDIQAAPYVALGATELAPGVDFLSIENKTYRKRLCRALHLSEKDLKLIYEKYEETVFAEIADAAPVGAKQEHHFVQLMLCYRLSKIATLTDSSISELFDLFDIINKDEAVRKYSIFDTLIPKTPTETDTYAMIASQDTANLMWLVPLLFALVKWGQKRQIETAELKYIQKGTMPDEKAQEAVDLTKIEALNSIYQQFKPTMLSQDYFVSDRFDERAARIIFNTIQSEECNLTAKEDNRILDFDPKKAEIASTQALQQMLLIQKEDFIGLGIEEKMQQKIYNNLIIKGFIEPNGTLIENTFPADPTVFSINFNQSEEKANIFNLIHDLYLEELEESGQTNGNRATNGQPNGNVHLEETEEFVNFAIFMSDFEELELSEVRKKELYDNLMFNGYIDGEGTVLQPAFFSEPANLEKFESSANIQHFSDKVYAIIQDRITAFSTQKLVLSSGVFSEIPLKEIELADLMENLRFNEYIDEKGVYLNKVEVLAATCSNFKLALQFYPHRKEILGAIQDQIQKFRKEFFTVTRDQLKDVAAEMVAELVFNHLEETYLEEGKFPYEVSDFFKEANKVAHFQPGVYFNANSTRIVFEAVQKIILEGEKYKLCYPDFRFEGFEDYDDYKLFDKLFDQGIIDKKGLINSEKLEFFLNIDNALGLEIEEFEDYQKDIFFEINKTAKELDAGVKEIVDKCQKLAEQQEEALFTALQEAFQLDADQVKALGGSIFRPKENLVIAFLQPILSTLNEEEEIIEVPKHKAFNVIWQRIQQFAQLAYNLNLGAGEIKTAFRDQSLRAKFPESLELPEGLTYIDSLVTMCLPGCDLVVMNPQMEEEKREPLETEELVEVIILSDFEKQECYLYDSMTYELLAPAVPLDKIFPKHIERRTINAAFNDLKGNTWVIIGATFYFKAKGKEGWECPEKELGAQETNFDKPEEIDAAFIDCDGKIYLFVGDQYARFSEVLTRMDEGYPKHIANNWREEFAFSIPEAFAEGIDAAVQDVEDTTYFFKDNQFISSAAPNEKVEINKFWGKIDNNFEDTDQIDAAFFDEGKAYLFAGDQVISYSNSIEHKGIKGDECSLLSLEKRFDNLPEEFHNGLDAAFKGADDTIYFFKDEEYYDMGNDGDASSGTLTNIHSKWGVIQNNIQDGFSVASKNESAAVSEDEPGITWKESESLVDAALAGLDGRAYIFSGNQFYRYSGKSFAQVDEGYPLPIADYWGGLYRIDSAFVLDGKTYIFGKDAALNDYYVRYSTNDYSEPDEDYPKQPTYNWWNLPKNLIKKGYGNPDAVFVGLDNKTYLFLQDEFVCYHTDELHRWWSKPQKLDQQWKDLNFTQVDAAFTGKDGRTYIFSKDNYIRYSDKTYNKIDERYPRPIKKFWGKVVNNIQKTGTVDAAMMVRYQDPISKKLEEESETAYTYLFSGTQFFRYTNDKYNLVDSGYPKTIATKLKEEPPFKNLTATLKRVDAAYADKRNIYLFKEEKLEVVSMEINTIYPFDGDRNAILFEEEGMVYMEGLDGWFRHRSIESDGMPDKMVPLLISEIPSHLRSFRSEQDAILIGTDKNRYIFKGKECYNESLKKAYPINETWGHLRNNIQETGQIDAAFVGVDCKTYVFSGDQYWQYESFNGSKGGSRAIAETHPKSIAENWGGLENVAIAYVKEEKTYLWEKPKEDGTFRYVCYHSDNYSKPIAPPQIGDISLLGIPEIYIKEGFTSIDAVLVADDNMFIFSKEEFLQYNETDDTWTYPREISLIWRGFNLKKWDADRLVTAFIGEENITYFFMEEGFVTYNERTGRMLNKFSPTEELFGRSDNNIIENNHIDAAFVDANEVTWIFSGDQYYKYTGTDYEFVEEGYPKEIAGNLREEACFQNLPASFDKKIKQWGSINNIFGSGRNIYLYIGNECFVFSKSLTQTYSIDFLGQLKNNIQTNNQVDAAFLARKDNRIVLLSGDQLFAYENCKYDYVLEGFPKSIQSFIQATKSEETLKDPESIWRYYGGVDAAFLNEKEESLKEKEDLYLFKEKDFILLGQKSQKEIPIKTVLANIEKKNKFPYFPIKGGFVRPTGEVYYFTETEYIRYADIDAEFVEEGYPKRIRDNWGDLPSEFETNIDGVFSYWGNIYMRKGDDYVRYSEGHYQYIDETYPRTFAETWKDKGDYLIGDIKTIVDYKHLNDNYLSGDYALADLLDKDLGYVKRPHNELAKIFDWEVEEIRWLKDCQVFLDQKNDHEVHFNMELILKMVPIFELATKAGIAPSVLFKEVYAELYDLEDTETPKVEEVANQLYAYLNWKNSDKDWEVLKKQLHDELNILKRDALLPYVIANDDSVDNARELFAKMLLDVEMGSEAKTSKIKEAISAIQLYFHRYFISLEEPRLLSEIPVGSSPEAENIAEQKGKVERKKLRQWWEWMKNYQVWEANRKVFLYPENYIRPELRDTKTDAFKNLEVALLSGDLTEDLVQTSFNNYLTEFTNVGNLKITGANEFDDGENDAGLVLFGHTRTEPRDYYYRTAKFTESGSTIWENWEKVNIGINAARVFPVKAFGRIMVFWIEIEDIEESKPVVKNNTENSTSTVETADKVMTHFANIKYSFYNFNKEWIAPQTLKSKIKLDYKIDAAYVDPTTNDLVVFAREFTLHSSKNNPAGDFKLIAEKYPDLPSDFHTGIDATMVHKGRVYFFKGHDVNIGDANDRASISNIFRPHEVIQNLNGWLIPTKAAGPPTNIEYFNGVAAAFSTGEEVCLIDYKGGYNFFKEDPNGGFIQSTDDIKDNNFWIWFIRLLTYNNLRLEPVDAVFSDENGIIYIIRNGQYECYRFDKDSIEKIAPLEGFPKPIRGNLSFNMDKFFNKLHVVNINDSSIELTYTTPKPEGDGALLKVEIQPDFSFKEIDIRTGFTEDFLINAEKTLGGFLSANNGTDANAIGVFRRITPDLLELQEKANEIHNMDNTIWGLSHRLIWIKGFAGEDLSSEDADLVERMNDSRAEMRGKLIQAKSTVKHYQDHRADLNKIFDDLLAVFPEDEDTNDAAAQLAAANQAELDGQEIEEKIVLEKAKVRQVFNGTLIQLVGTSRKWNVEIYGKVADLVKIIEEVVTKNETKNIEGLRINSSNLNVITAGLTSFGEKKEDFVAARNALLEAGRIELGTDFAEVRSQITATKETLDRVLVDLDGIINTSEDFDNHLQLFFKDLILLKELYFGSMDVFDEGFEIKNTANFTFGRINWYVFEAKGGTFLARPIPMSTPLKYEIIRLTTNVIPLISNRLFAQGIDGLLNLSTQEINESPSFKQFPANVMDKIKELVALETELAAIEDAPFTIEHAANKLRIIPLKIGILVLRNAVETLKKAAWKTHPGKTILYSSLKIKNNGTGEEIDDQVPTSSHLDFKGANANYYWEIFFHAPFLIANALNNAQKFEQAKKWYEYIFDPANKETTWQFLPINNVGDLKADFEDFLLGETDLSDLQTELEIYRNDPFDPHAIARLRKIAYPKAMVMRYIDNLLDWGDMLFRQYTIESINEARMLYVLAYDLLGNKPESLGKKIIPDDRNFSQLENPPKDDVLLLEKTVHQSIDSPYFHLPENDLFLEYWDRVEDRLFKIRQSLNIEGVKQALPLFQPPIDPMSIVQAVGAGASLSQALSNSNIAIPHYRFSFMLYKARELQQKLSAFSGELLNAFEKRDSEELSLILNKQEGQMMDLMTRIKEAQIEESATSITSLQKNLYVTKARGEYNQGTYDADWIDAEISQISMQSLALGLHATSATLKFVAMAASSTPDALIGPFIAGIKIGGSNAGESLNAASEGLQSITEGLSVLGEILGTVAAHQRQRADWGFEAEMALYDAQQIEAQIQGAQIQKKMAEYELDMHLKEKENHAAVTKFMNNRFTNKELYLWMSSRLSKLYYKAYKMAYDMAKTAEKAFQFEKGLKASEVNYINGSYWNSQRNGLLAGDALGSDLDRLELAFLEKDHRRFEITKSISMLELDPMAFIRLKAKGVCEFDLSEALYDYDFQGHYCRQIRTLSFSFDAGEGQTINATLTQLHNKTILEPDAKAVKYLIDPKGEQPLSIRSNWKAQQQIALSYVEEYGTNNGLFEMRFDDDKYLPFEGTGAVSRWRLELNGKKGSYNLEELLDITINIKYTALQGGQHFANAVKGMLKPYETVKYIDINYEFHNKWMDFLRSDAEELVLIFTQDQFPNMASSKVEGIYSKFELIEAGNISMVMNDDDNLLLKDHQYLETSGLKVGKRGTEFSFRVKGDKSNLKNMVLIMGYKAHV